MLIKLTNQGDLKFTLHKPNPRDLLISLESVRQQSGSNHVGHHVSVLFVVPLDCHWSFCD